MRSWGWAGRPAAYGRRAEGIAAWWLRLHGYRVVARNLRVAGREVDLVARRGSLLVVCEVKARRGLEHPLEAVGARQQQRLREAADLLAARDPGVRRVRLDVIGVEGLRPRHYPGAFE